VPHILVAPDRITRYIWRGQAALFLLLCGLLPAAFARADTQATSVTLNWTAPGDDSTRGVATVYDLRRSSTPITELNFTAATIISGMGLPKTAGSPESFTVTGLTSGVPYYFAIRTRDDAGNWSRVSNLAVYPQNVGVEQGDGTTLSFSTPFPNPCRQTARFAYSLPRAATMGVDVYDVSGRSIRNLIRGMRPAGRADLVWDLRTDRGDAVSPGVYLVRARIDDQEYMRRVVVTR
jgi:hypothetical protein